MHFFYFWLNTDLVQIVFVFDKSLTLLNSNKYYLKAERKEGGRKKMEDILDIFLKCSLLEKNIKEYHLLPGESRLAQNRI